MKKQISSFLLCCMFLSLLAACGRKEPAPSPADPSPETSGSETTEESHELPVTDTKPPQDGPEVLEVKWNPGYVGSAQSQHPNEIYASPASCYSYTDVITVPKAGTKIYFSDDGGRYAAASAYVVSLWRQTGSGWEIDPDAKHYAGSGSSVSDVLRMQGGNLNYVYVTAKDEEYIRLCYRSEQTAEFTPVFPKVYAEATEEEPTSAEWNNLIQWIKEHKKGMNHTALNGLTINLLGDSYFAGNGLDPNYVWPALMARKYGMFLHNGGINGSTVSNYVTTNHPMCVRYRDLPDNDPDIVLVEGGRNDFNKKVPIGEPDSTDTKTFSGALNTILSGLRKKYPEAVIICMTNWNFPGINDIGLGYADYAGAMKTAAKRYGLPCLDASDPEVSGVDMTDAAFKAAYCMTPNSVSHLNLEGMKLVLPYFESYLDQCYTEKANRKK